MRTEIDMYTLNEMISALNHYHTLIGHIDQLTKSERLKEFCEKLFFKKAIPKQDGPDTKPYFVEMRDYATTREYWKNINMYVVTQNWSNTACGWEGFGGCAMTDAYTVIIENEWHNAIYVYYGGKLAYIAQYNEALLTHKAKGFRFLPGMSSLQNLDVIYKSH